jgi:hypothetical protein
MALHPAPSVPAVPSPADGTWRAHAAATLMTADRGAAAWFEPEPATTAIRLPLVGSAPRKGSFRTIDPAAPPRSRGRHRAPDEPAASAGPVVPAGPTVPVPTGVPLPVPRRLPPVQPPSVADGSIPQPSPAVQ